MVPIRRPGQLVPAAGGDARILIASARKNGSSIHQRTLFAMPVHPRMPQHPRYTGTASHRTSPEACCLEGELVGMGLAKVLNATAALIVQMMTMGRSKKM